MKIEELLDRANQSLLSLQRRHGLLDPEYLMEWASMEAVQTMDTWTQEELVLDHPWILTDACDTLEDEISFFLFREMYSLYESLLSSRTYTVRGFDSSSFIEITIQL